MLIYHHNGKIYRFHIDGAVSPEIYKTEIMPDGWAVYRYVLTMQSLRHPTTKDIVHVSGEDSLEIRGMVLAEVETLHKTGELCLIVPFYTDELIAYSLPLYYYRRAMRNFPQLQQLPNVQTWKVDKQEQPPLKFLDVLKYLPAFNFGSDVMYKDSFKTVNATERTERLPFKYLTGRKKWK